MPDDDEQQPDMRTNHLKVRKSSAATRADGAPRTLAPAGGNPLRGVLTTLETAWVSPSRQRSTFVETLEGIGTAVTGAFAAQAEQCRSEAALEPSQVDADDPYEGWKASPDRINARMNNPYASGGY